MSLDVSKPCSVQQLAAVTKVPIRTLQRWCRDGHIPARRIGPRKFQVVLPLLEDSNPDLFAMILERYHSQDDDGSEVRGF